jgi:hypothetical protein
MTRGPDAAPAPTEAEAAALLAATVTDPARLAALDALAILGTAPAAEFDDIVRVASEVCGMPVSLISLLDGDRQWFKAETGFGQSETPLSQSICAYAVQQDDVFEIEDLTRDARTSDNPLVTGGPEVRFYAGALLRSPEGCLSDKGIALCALIQRKVRDHKGFGLLKGQGADRLAQGGLASGKADPGLEPLPLARDKAHQGHGGPACP